MEAAIRYYFNKQYKYQTILDCLEKFHDIKISKRTLLNKLKEYGLGRRRYNANDDQVRECIQQELDGNGRLLGYRAMWRKLQSHHGIYVRRLTVQTILSELDPEGSRLRKAHRLQRREYLNPGPNYSWHADGYDKLKQFGFPIHGCIDGFSRRIMWLEIVRTNNNPHVVGKLFLDCIKEQRSCPTVLRTDKGTENGIMATAQCFLRRNHVDGQRGTNAHRYGSSHTNQRIEAWWAMLRRSWSSWWINFFKDLAATGVLDTSNEIHLECLWFCFVKVMKKDLKGIKESWNTHYIRKSRYYTAHGIPDQLFFLPESVGAENYQKEYLQPDMDEVERYIATATEDESHQIYQEYFEYSSAVLGFQEPNTWRESLAMFQRLIGVAE
ncbi:uncharacterized protein LOC114532100 [Dendronephthya gigantea]|uniref:uncharacterized protein LOC114532100 n=1 Tax=Dendronephthya gigantea TaxID=151771 RepID=UPI00106AC14D|nr:uncharacterized protein LOC114532100 [Dendronephthya gigantea]